MPPYDFPRRVAAEGIGTLVLVAAVIGSGVMADRLSGGSVGLALLANTIATGAILIVLITVLAPISAQFNPAVSLVLLLRGALPARELLPIVLVQSAAAILGAVLAHAMFDLPLVEFGITTRAGPSQWLGEAVATFALLFAILGGARVKPEAIAWLVGLVIVSAYWFTSSTSFANPAVTLGRAFTASFAGIRPVDVFPFVLAQLAGALAAHAVMGWLMPVEKAAKPA